MLSETKRSSKGQKGIISTLSFNPDYSKTFAAGSYGDSVGIYVENMNGCALEMKNLELGGVTCVKWAPNGQLLYIGGRNCNDIVCWDVRSTRTEIGRYSRELNTNQRMQFDIDAWGKYLITGSENSELLIYDTLTCELVAKSRPTNSTIESSSTMMETTQPITTSTAATKEVLEIECPNSTDCMNTAIFHPYSSIIITCTGQRHFDDSTTSHESESDNEKSQNNGNMVNETSSSQGIQLWMMDRNVIQVEMEQP